MAYATCLRCGALARRLYNAWGNAESWDGQVKVSAAQALSRLILSEESLLRRQTDAAASLAYYVGCTQSMRKTPLPSAEPAEGSRRRSPAKAPADPMAMLRKEVDIMRSLRHPNIVALHEV